MEESKNRMKNGIREKDLIYRVMKGRQEERRRDVREGKGRYKKEWDE